MTVFFMSNLPDTSKICLVLDVIMKSEIIAIVSGYKLIAEIANLHNLCMAFANLKLLYFLNLRMQILDTITELGTFCKNFYRQN